MNITDEIAPAKALSPSRLSELNQRLIGGTKIVRVLVLDDNEDDFAFVIAERT